MKRLYRVESEKKIAGVCGGLGEYFDLDPVLFRIAFILLACMGGFGFLLYVVMWFVVPVKGGSL